jgi:hypothetical protein
MPTQIVLCNKTSQTLSVSVRDDAGVVRELKIEAAGKSEPVQESALTAHTRNLITAGHIRVRPV